MPVSGTSVKMRVIGGDFSVCKLDSIDTADFSDDFVFLSKTDSEVSLVCQTEHVPSEAIAVTRGFCMLGILGQLDFGLTGIISGITGILADNGIVVFVVSTYDTDYILIKHDRFNDALYALSNTGYTFV